MYRTPINRLNVIATSIEVTCTSRRMLGRSAVLHRVIGTNRNRVSRHSNYARRRVMLNRHPSRGDIRRCNITTGYRCRSTQAAEGAASSVDAATTATKASSAVEAAASTTRETPPSARQLTMHALRSAVPMIGFGFMDNTIMIHAGHYVDCTLGVTFGLSTLAAAGIGQVFSGIGGVMFGDALDRAFRKFRGSTKMTSVQRTMRSARIAGLTGGIVGVTLGCVLGLVNLLFVDEHKASLLKLQALEDGQEFEFEVEVDNEIHPGYTTVIVRGPDVDGVLASITASIASIGCSVVELHAENRVRKTALSAMMDDTESDHDDNTTEPGEESNNNNASITSLLDQIVQSSHQSQPKMEDIFLIRDRSTHQAIDNEDLDYLARTVLAAAKDPLNSHSLKAQVDGLQLENMALADRVLLLESMLEDRQIKVVTSSNKVVGGKE